MRRLTAALCAATLTAACSGDPQVTPIEPDGGASATETEDTTPPATGGTDDDPFAVPDEIDDAYVQAVLDELFALRSEAIELTIAAADGDQLDPPDEAAFLNDAIHEGPERGQFGESLFEATNANNLDEVFLPEDQFEGERFPVERLVRADDSCIIVIGSYDRTGTLRQPGSARLSVLTLAPAEPTGDDLNPAPWRIRDMAAPLEDGEPANPEEVMASPDEDWLAFLDTSCDIDGDDSGEGDDG